MGDKVVELLVNKSFAPTKASIVKAVRVLADEIENDVQPASKLIVAIMKPDGNIDVLARGESMTRVEAIGILHYAQNQIMYKDNDDEKNAGAPSA